MSTDHEKDAVPVVFGHNRAALKEQVAALDFHKAQAKEAERESAEADARKLLAEATKRVNAAEKSGKPVDRLESVEPESGTSDDETKSGPTESGPGATV